MVKAFDKSFNTVEELEISQKEELVSIQNFDNRELHSGKRETLLPVQKFEPALFERVPCRKFLVLE